MIVNQIAMVFGFLRWRFKHPRLLVKAYTLFSVAWTVFWILVVTAYLSTNPLNMVPLGLLLADLVIISIFILPPFPPLYYYWKSSRILTTPPTIVKKGEVLERDTLFDDWKQFITLYPEEKLVHAYRDVNALYHADEIKSAREGIMTIHRGDLILTNRRLAYLEYRYEEVSLTPKMKLMKILDILLLMVTIVACIASVFLPLMLLTLPIVLICLFLLSRISKRLPALPPIGYEPFLLQNPPTILAERL
jgi:hypothetical protein